MLLEKQSSVELCPPAPFWGFSGVILSFVSLPSPLLQHHPLFDLFCQCRLVVCIFIFIKSCQINSHRLAKPSEYAIGAAVPNSPLQWLTQQFALNLLLCLDTPWSCLIVFAGCWLGTTPDQTIITPANFSLWSSSCPCPWIHLTFQLVGTCFVGFDHWRVEFNWSLVWCDYLICWLLDFLCAILFLWFYWTHLLTLCCWRTCWHHL